MSFSLPDPPRLSDKLPAGEDLEWGAAAVALSSWIISAQKGCLAASAICMSQTNFKNRGKLHCLDLYCCSKKQLMDTCVQNPFHVKINDVLVGKHFGQREDVEFP